MSTSAAKLKATDWPLWGISRFLLCYWGTSATTDWLSGRFDARRSCADSARDTLLTRHSNWLVSVPGRFLEVFLLKLFTRQPKPLTRQIS